MKKIIISAASLVFLLLFPILVLADYRNLSQQPSGRQPSIKILSLNVMQFAAEPRDSRFQKITDYLQTAPVHLLALQELSGGPYDTPPTQDSGADLANMLAAAGLNYGYYTEANWGYPPYLVYKVGLLPRYIMTATASGSTGAPTDGWVFPERKNVVMCQLNIPGFGKLNAYSVHIYDPASESTEQQIDNLLAFVKQTDGQYPAVAALIAGDMNFSVNDNPAAYQKFIDQGFIDSYAAANGFTDPRDCCSQSNPTGCTFGVPGNPLRTSDTPSRIDFIFVKGKDIRIKSSKVVFNGVTGPFVSDHCAVLTEIAKISLDPARSLLLGD